MRIPGNLQEHYRIILEESINIDNLFRNFSISTGEKLLRLYAAPFLKYVPTGWRYFITDFAKHLRNPSGKAKINYPMDFDENRKIALKLKGTGLNPWWGKKAVISLSHDVDNNIGYSFVEKMAYMDYNACIPSTFNFLTHDNYHPDKLLLKQLIIMGMEIGLHGYNHDQGFSYRKPAIIEKRLIKALLDINEFGITGTRTPALSKSDSYFRSISKAGLKYDSSLQIGSGIYTSIRLPYPYYFREYGIWEIPLMIQDDNYLRDSFTSESEILSSIRRFINETIDLNGVMVLNMHPHLMCDRSELYLKVLNVLQEYSETVNFATSGMVYKYVENNSEDI